MTTVNNYKRNLENSHIDPNVRSNTQPPFTYTLKRINRVAGEEYDRERFPICRYAPSVIPDCNLANVIVKQSVQYCKCKCNYIYVVSPV